MTPAIRGNSYAEGNSGGGAPEGNDNARNNDGGAPPGNLNAVKHHGYCNPLTHYHRLEGVAREHADEIIAGEREVYAEYHIIDEDDVEAHIVEHREFGTEEDVRDAFRRLGAMSEIFFRSAAFFFEHGPVTKEEHEYETEAGETATYTTHKPNPVWEADHRRYSQRRRLELALGLIEKERHLCVWVARRPDWVTEWAKNIK